MAVYETLAVKEQQSNWFQFHTRQALWFGIVAAAAAFVALVWPLLASAVVGTLAGGAVVGATIWIYGVAFLMDLAIFAVVLVLAVGYSRRAARGDMFEIPFVRAITRRVGVKR